MRICPPLAPLALALALALALLLPPLAATPAWAEHPFAPDGCDFRLSLPARGLEGGAPRTGNGEAPRVTARYPGYTIEAVCFPVPACDLDTLTDAERRRTLFEMAPGMGQLRDTVTRTERTALGPVGVYEGTVPNAPIWRAIRLRLHWGSCSRLALLFDGDPARGGQAWRKAMDSVERTRR